MNVAHENRSENRDDLRPTNITWCKKTARAFLAALARDAVAFTFQTFGDNKHSDRQGLVRTLHGSLDQHWGALRALSDSGAGVFVTINETDLRGRKTDNIIRVRAYFADLDGAPLESIMRLGLPPNIVVESSDNRWHTYWIVEDAQLSEFRPTQLRLARLFGGDSKVCDLPRVMRIPGFPHQKNPSCPMTVDFESLPIFGYQNAKVQAALSQAEAKLGLLPLEETRVSGTRPARAANVTKDAPLPSTAELLIPAIKPSPDDEQAKRRSLTEKLAATNVRVPFSEMEAARVVSALDKLSAEDRNMWFEMGAAIHSLDWGERGFEIWDDWSQTIPTKYDEIEQRKTWESFAREYSGRKVTIATLFRRAKNAGWIEAAARQDYETDLGNARRLVRRHGGNIRYVHSWRKWLVWSGERWIIDSDGAIVRLADTYSRCSYRNQAIHSYL